MTLRSTAKRWTYLVHRWLGIGGCLLMLLWFVSGMVMLFIGYPKLTPGERLAALPVLGEARDLQGLSVLPAAVQAEPEAVALTTLRGEPAYVVRSGSNVGAWSAVTGQALLPVSAQRAEASAAQFAGGQAFVGAMRVNEDRWTHSRALDAHRPLYRVEVGGAQPGDLYVSSRTGEVVLDAPHVQQRWNYVGAWLHWLYFLRMQSVDPVWTWVVIVLSALCTVAAISGIVVGVWRWRFRGHYRSGAKTPYVESWMRWHHLIGLCAAAFVFTWIFSGLMSMNPLGVFSSTGEAIDVEHYRGGAVAVDGALGDLRSFWRWPKLRASSRWRSSGDGSVVSCSRCCWTGRVIRASCPAAMGTCMSHGGCRPRGCSRGHVRCPLHPSRVSWCSMQRMRTSTRVRPRP